MRKGIIKTLSVVALAGVLFGATATQCKAETGADVSNFSGSADAVESVDEVNNVYVSGQNANIQGGIHFAGYGAGYNVKAEGTEFSSDVALAGYNVEVDNSTVGDTIYLAGYNVTVQDSAAEGNMILAGYSINVLGDSSAKAVTAAGCTVEFNGKAQCLNLSGESVTLGGDIAGDVSISANKVTIADDVKIGGTLTVNAVDEPAISKSAEIADYAFTPIVEDEDEEASKGKSIGREILSRIGSGFYWSVAMIIVALLMCWLADDSIAFALEMVKTRCGIMLGSGAITLFALPVAIIIAMVTVIGIPAALLTASVAAFLLCISVTFAGASLARLVFGKINPVLASVAGVAILQFAKQIPFVGGLIFLAAAIYTLGFFVQRLYLLRIKKK